MKNKLTIFGSCPSKKNSKIISCRGNRPCLFPSKNYTAWHKDALLQLLGKQKIESKELTITFYVDSIRKYDLSNKTESIMDTLVDAGLLIDDNYLEVPILHLKHGGIDKLNPRCEIEY